MAQTISSTHEDHAKALLFPPVVGAVLALLGVGLHLAYPINVLPNSWLTLTIGILALGFGIVLQVVCIKAFKRAQTTPLFKKPTTRIIQQGPYARSRNPIYVAVLFQFLGVALIVNSVWLLLALLIIFLYLNFGVIDAEEQYLEQKFGDEYREYKSKVRRWL